MPEGFVTVGDASEGRDFWLAQGLGKGLEQKLQTADVLIVPEKDFRPGFPFLFHQDTGHLYQYLSSHLGGKLSVEICATDEEYREIALHAAAFRLSTLVVQYGIAPLVVGLLTNYLYDELKAKPTDTVEATVVVEDQQCKSFKFQFKGEAKEFGSLADKVGQMARDCEAKSRKHGATKARK